MARLVAVAALHLLPFAMTTADLAHNRSLMHMYVAPTSTSDASSRVAADRSTRAGRPHDLDSSTRSTPHRSLHTALAALRRYRDQAGGLRKPVQLHLLPGVHALREPLLLTARDSHVHFSGATVESGTVVGTQPEVVVSGGVELGPWVDVGVANCTGCSRVWRAAVPAGSSPAGRVPRHVFVNDRRVQRPWAPFPGLSLPAALAPHRCPPISYRLAFQASVGRDVSGWRKQMATSGQPMPPPRSCHGLALLGLR